MHGDGVLGLEGDAFYDVNFAIVGPGGADHPEGRPDAALGGWTVSEGAQYFGYSGRPTAEPGM